MHIARMILVHVNIHGNITVLIRVAVILQLRELLQKQTVHLEARASSYRVVNLVAVPARILINVLRILPAMITRHEAQRHLTAVDTQRRCRLPVRVIVVTVPAPHINRKVGMFLRDTRATANRTIIDIHRWQDNSRTVVVCMNTD